MKHESRHSQWGLSDSQFEEDSASKAERTIAFPTFGHDDGLDKTLYRDLDDCNDCNDCNDGNDGNDYNDCNYHNESKDIAKNGCEPADQRQPLPPSINQASSSSCAITTSGLIASRASHESTQSSDTLQDNPYPQHLCDHTATRPTLPSRTSSFSSDTDTDDSLPGTPLSVKFPISIGAQGDPYPEISSCLDTPRTSLDLLEVDQTPRERSDSFGIIKAKGCVPRRESVIRTPPNARLTKLDRELLSEPSASLLRPTTFWRHHPLSPHSLPHHSPSSRLIRRSLLIASPTISVQQPDPDAETTRIAVGLAGLDLDIDPRRKNVNLLPI
ncbi:hypothetical protein I317_04580 [Kwoniella heveanensis CBS 569]|nr:hypothetical protein I317_04580 [Kwoniella heveanensis CBS 569]